MINPEIVVPPAAPLRRAMQAMTTTGRGIILVVDPKRKLLGVMTDIDVRKALLSGSDMTTPVSRVMNRHPITVSDRLSREEISNIFRKMPHSYFPVVDARGRLKDLAAQADYRLIPQRFSNRILVMAGGFGKRLLPLTASTPKPMLRVGDKPILELLLEQLIASGFGHFIFSVGYLAGQIKTHFDDGKRWGVEIDYIHEDQPLGTAGALRLVPREHLGAPILVVNGDILTKVNFAALLKFHEKAKALATICVKPHEIQVPYGVVELNDERLHAFIEKPVHRWLVNAGIYIVEPKTVGWLPKRGRCDMPDFIAAIRKRRADGVACFPIQEYWLDIGGMKEYERAHGELKTRFNEL